MIFKCACGHYSAFHLITGECLKCKCKRMRQKSEKQKLRDECTKLLRKIVYARDGHRCLRCGKTAYLNASHIYPKGRYRSMEHEPLNVQCLCYGCHLHFFHKHPLAAHEWLETVMSKKDLDRLKLMSQTSGRIDLKLTKIFLEKELKKYELSK